MTDSDPTYDMGTLRKLLLAAFTAEDMHRFCEDRPTLRPIASRFGPQQGLDDMVEEVIRYCDVHHVFDELVAAVEQENPAQYAQFEPFLRAGEQAIAIKTLRPGSTLLKGKYRIVRHLARGGFGSVYLAEDTLLSEQVAVKEMVPALVGDEGALKRFLVEAKTTLKLAHPHVIHTRDVFAEAGNYYMVMEYAPAGSLEDRLKQGKALPVEEAVRIIAEVCEGLAYAHSQGVVHCDLKPANIMFGADGVAKVADFGVAHVSEQALTRSWATPQGFVAGTLPYMSPEQADGVRDDPRVDVYALGAVLYRALTGRTYLDFDERDTPLAQGNNVHRICSETPPPPSSHNSRIPAWLDAVTLKALAKQPADRYSSADALRGTLLAAAPATPDRVRTAPPATPAYPDRPAGPPPSRPARPAETGRVRQTPLPRWLLPAIGGVGLLVVALIAILVITSVTGRDGTPTPPPGQSDTPLVIVVTGVTAATPDKMATSAAVRTATAQAAQTAAAQTAAAETRRADKDTLQTANAQTAVARTAVAQTAAARTAAAQTAAAQTAEAQGVPILLSPADGAVLDNGTMDRTDAIVWDFDWSDCPGATHYHLSVMGPTASKPIIDDDAIATSSYHHASNGYIAGNYSGWKWKVQAYVGGEWGAWSETGVFDVEPVDTDAAGAGPLGNASFEQDPTTTSPRWFADTRSADAKADWSTDRARTGTHSLYLRVNTSSSRGWPGWFTTEPIKIAPGQDYVLSVWAYTQDGAGAWVAVNVLDDKENSIVGYSSGCAGSLPAGSWYQIKLKVPISDVGGAASVRLGLQQCLTYSHGNSLYYDDVALDAASP